MALVCTTAGRECDGCQACQERQVIETCIVCHEDIYAGDCYYSIDGESVHMHCLEQWAEHFLVFPW